MAKTRKTYMVEDHVDHKIEVIAAVEGKPKSVVVEEAFQKYFVTKDFLKALTKPRVRAAAAAAGSERNGR
jgi:hypothetical protein